MEQARQYTLNILTYISRLGEYRGIDNGEWHIEQFGNGAGKESLTGTCASHHYYITLLDLHSVGIFRLLEALVVIIYGNGKKALGIFLTNHVLVEICLYLLGLWHLEGLGCLLVLLLHCTNRRLLQYSVCLLGTIITDIAVKASYKQLYILLTATAETTCFPHHSSFLSIPCLSFHTRVLLQQSSNNYGRSHSTPSRMEYVSDLR